MRLAGAGGQGRPVNRLGDAAAAPTGQPALLLRGTNLCLAGARDDEMGCYRTLESTLRPSWPLRRFVVRPNDDRFVHNAAFSYRPPFRPFRYHPNAARSPLKPIETSSGC